MAKWYVLLWLDIEYICIKGQNNLIANFFNADGIRKPLHPCNDIYEETISLIDQNKYEISSCGTQYQNVY